MQTVIILITVFYFYIMAKILITGGTGLIGLRLKKTLIDKNHEVIVLTREPKNNDEFMWDLSSNYIDEKALENTDYIIHLAGAGIAEKRWTKKRKKIIIDSRVKTTNMLLKKVNELKIDLKGFISASGVGYYGALTTEEIFKETAKPGSDFLADVCQKWEQAAQQFSTKNTAVTIVRTGIVLAPKGGALEKMKTPIIVPLGSGEQHLPWIHIDDLCHIYLKIIDNNLTGVFNAVSPEHHTNKTFSKVLAKSLKRPYIGVGIPRIALKVLFGKLAVLLLEGSRISSKKIEKNGYSFRFKTLAKALNNL